MGVVGVDGEGEGEEGRGRTEEAAGEETRFVSISDGLGRGEDLARRAAADATRSGGGCGGFSGGGAGSKLGRRDAGRLPAFIDFAGDGAGSVTGDDSIDASAFRVAVEFMTPSVSEVTSAAWRMRLTWSNR